MAQPILKRRLNPFLLISTVVALSLLAGVAVISQDQISQKQNQISNLQNDNSRLEKQVNSLNSEIGNETVQIQTKNDNLTRMQNKVQELQSNLSTKKEEIQKLQNQVEQNQRSNQSNALEEMNTSLQTVCFLGESWQSRNIAVENCQQWGHNIES